MTEVLNSTGKSVDLDEMDCSDPTTTIEDSPSAGKKLKQARLPFKPIGPKTQLTMTPHGLPKKRKLSDQESPSAKAAKVVPKHQCDRGRVDVSEKQQAVTLDHDNEVSSSSEAENIPLGSLQKRKGFENNILERFVRKSFQEEISSTNEVVDLTDETDANSNASEVGSSVVCIKDNRRSDSVITVEVDEISVTKLPNEMEITKNVKENSPLKVLSDSESDEATGESHAQEVEVKTSCEAPESNVCNTNNQLGDTSRDKSLDTSTSSKTASDESSTSSSDDSCEDGNNDSAVDVSVSSQGNNSSANTSTCKTPKTKSATSPRRTRTPGGSSVQTSTPKNTRGKPQSLKMSEIKSQEKRKEREAMRQRVREQRERERRERKEKKERERLEAKQKKEEEKVERERKKMEEKEKKERERQEKKEQLEKEKMEKQQQREEEKKKKQEMLDAKMEEKRKREEEKRFKEEEKVREEEEKNKKKMKEKESFSSFFIKRAQQQAAKPKETCFFMPFEVKKDMFLAPPCRRQLSQKDKLAVDEYLTGQVCGNLYLSALKEPCYEKGRSQRTLPRVKDATPTPDPDEEEEQDVKCLESSQEKKKKNTERHHCKLLQFHTNYRPPYYGTWHKTSKVIKATKPFSQDTELLDYEVDSDDEWEEEEPGESVSSSEDEGEEKEEEGEDDEEEDGWMVPHGYLSEDEGCDQDEEVTPEVLKARQMAKQEAWEAELKKQKAPVRAVVIGCVWDGDDIAVKLANKLAVFRAVCLSTVPIDTRKLLNDVKGGKDSDKNGGTGKGNRKPVPEEAMPDLIRLLHRNVIGIKKVIKEFRLYWKRKTSNSQEADGDNMDVDESDKDLSALDQSCSDEKMLKDGEVDSGSPGRDKTAESADGCGMSKRQLELKIMSIAVREKRPDFKKVCWYVHDKVLEQYKMEDLPAINNWQYVSKGLIRVKNEEACGRRTPNNLSESFTEAVQNIMKDEEETDGKADKPKDQPSIMQFAKKMHPSELPKPKIQRIELKPAGSTLTEAVKRVQSPVTDLDMSPNEEQLAPYKTLPKDQRSIMDFAKKSGQITSALSQKSRNKPNILQETALTPAKSGIHSSSGEVTQDRKTNSPGTVLTDKVIPSATDNTVAMETEECIVLD